MEKQNIYQYAFAIYFDPYFTIAQFIQTFVSAFLFYLIISKSFMQETLPHSWLSQIDDEASIADISFPGTHDSAAFQSSSKIHCCSSGTWQTQKYNFQWQLQHGIRAFDIRVGIDEGEPLRLYHGPIELCPFPEMCQHMREFLEKNPREFIIFMLGKERGDCDQKAASRIFKAQTAKQKLPFVYSNKIPKVKNLRGKIWVIATNSKLGMRLNTFRVSTHQPILTKDMRFWVQNFWDGPQTNKQQAIHEILMQPTAGKLIKINYLSQAFGSSMDSFLSQISLKKISKHYNQFCHDAIDKTQQHRSLGIILMDYPEQELIMKIVQRNKYCTEPQPSDDEPSDDEKSSEDKKQQPQQE